MIDLKLNLYSRVPLFGHDTCVRRERDCAAHDKDERVSDIRVNDNEFDNDNAEDKINVNFCFRFLFSFRVCFLSAFFALNVSLSFT